MSSRCGNAIAALCCFLSLSFLGACQSTNPAAAAKSLPGQWVRMAQFKQGSLVLSLELMGNGVFEIKALGVRSGVPPLKGHYRVDGDTLIFSDRQSPEEGNYDWKLTDDILLLSIEDDDFWPRTRMLAGSWLRYHPVPPEK